MKKYRLLAGFLTLMVLAAGCGQTEREETGENTGRISEEAAADQEGSSEQTNEVTTMTEGESITKAVLPDKLAEIPQEYFSEADQQGTLVELEYDTYESMTYEEQEQVLHKRAIVYLPYEYSEDKQYNVFYLMHGGWSNETTYLGTPDQPNASSDYSLALRLTENYHNELIHDLIPAVEGTYSTYAEDTTLDGIRSSRDHRAFCGFSMGSVATWRTFQYCLDYFRYFMPSSGSLTSDGEYMASLVQDSGHEWNDFFIFAASGTEDFAYSSFKNQIEAMADVNDGTFRYANNERQGNLYFLEQEGGTHSGEYAMEYFYNGLCWIWQ